MDALGQLPILCAWLEVSRRVIVKDDNPCSDRLQRCNHQKPDIHNGSRYSATRDLINTHHAVARIHQQYIAIAPWLANARQRFFFNFWSDLLLKDKSLFAAYNTLTALGINAQNNMNDQGFVDTAHVFENTGFNQDLPLFIQTLANIDIAPYLNKIQSKTKVIGFSLDTIAPFQMAKEISALIPNAAFAEIDAGHAGPWEATDKMNEEIENFIS